MTRTGVEAVMTQMAKVDQEVTEPMTIEKLDDPAMSGGMAMKREAWLLSKAAWRSRTTPQ